MVHVVCAVDTFPFFFNKFILHFMHQKRDVEKRYENSIGQNLILREIKFFDFVVPEEKKQNLYEDLKTFEAELMNSHRWNQRSGTVNEMLKMIQPFLGPFIIPDLTKVVKNEKEIAEIRKSLWFANTYPLAEVKDEVFGKLNMTIQPVAEVQDGYGKLKINEGDGILKKRSDLKIGDELKAEYW